MEINIPVKSLGGSGFTVVGGVLTTPLILSRNPLEDLEAATKQYVDLKSSSIRAETITSGTLEVDRFPSFTGDVVSEAGSGVIELNLTGVTPGVYTKVTVNSKGRVTVGGFIDEIDIPNLNWNKITTSKPTTLAGYGITDALSKAGGDVSGFITCSSIPTQSLHSVNKAYVDSVLIKASELPAGDIILRASSITPSGFLRCDGSEVSKTTYSDLYNVIGNSYGTPTISTNFILPDFMQNESNGLYYYIKY